MGNTKYTQAKQEANARYDSKTYKVYAFRLRIEDDADIIKDIDEAKENGVSYREWLRNFFEGKK